MACRVPHPCFVPRTGTFCIQDNLCPNTQSFNNYIFLIHLDNGLTSIPIHMGCLQSYPLLQNQILSHNARDLDKCGNNNSRPLIMFVNLQHSEASNLQTNGSHCNGESQAANWGRI